MFTPLLGGFGKKIPSLLAPRKFAQAKQFPVPVREIMPKNRSSKPFYFLKLPTGMLSRVKSAQ
jgi:hypothetical protein